MSYMFTVVRDESGIRLIEPVPDVLKHIPIGKFNVIGHISDGKGHVSILTVTLSDSKERFVAGATSNYCTNP